MKANSLERGRTSRRATSGREESSRIAFETLLDGLGERCVGRRVEDPDAELKTSLAQVAAFFDVELAELYERHWDARLSVVDLAYAPGSETAPPGFGERDVPWLAAELSRGKAIRICSLDDVPANAARDRRAIERRGHRAAVFCPVAVDGTVAGTLVLSSRRTRRWPDELVGRLRLVAHLFGAALAVRRARTDVVQQQELTRAVLDSLPGLFFTVDEEGRLVDWNRTRELVTGFSNDELHGRHFLDFMFPEYRARAAEAFRRTFEEGSGQFENDAMTKDGHRIPHIVSGRRVTVAGKRYIAGMALDISALRAAEDHIRRQQSELAHVARVSAMGELAAAIAHELNQPLTAIMTNAQVTRRALLGRAADPAELDEALGDITADAVRAGEVIRRLRDLLRKGDAEKLPLDVNELIRGVEPLARMDALQNNVSLVMALAPELPPIAGDRIQLQQVMLNLIRNGSEAMRDESATPGNLVVRTALARPDAVEVTVEDVGPPLSDEAFARMFEPFYTTKAGGLGVGLSISRSIVEAHGGLLWATRNPERGLTMHLTLPCAELTAR